VALKYRRNATGCLWRVTETEGAREREEVNAYIRGAEREREREREKEEEEGGEERLHTKGTVMADRAASSATNVKRETRWRITGGFALSFSRCARERKRGTRRTGDVARGSLVSRTVAGSARE